MAVYLWTNHWCNLSGLYLGDLDGTLDEWTSGFSVC